MDHLNDDLIRLVDAWQTRKIVVAGDFMLDRYSYGNAERLSPDAPVPILTIERTEDRPGGAANVCLDLQALRCEVVCLGAVGDDDTGQALRRSLERCGCDVAGLVTADDRPTIVKHNFVGLAQHRHPQKMFRADWERREPLSQAIGQRLIAQAEQVLDGAAVLCLEDYNKGVLTEQVCQALIALARDRNIPVLVDPAAVSDYSKYRGASCVTPNRTEAELVTGMNSLEAADQPAVLHAMAEHLLQGLALTESVVLTLDKQGAFLLERVEPRSPSEGTAGQASRGTPDPGVGVWVPTVARSVYDVTGAGDMVLAMLAAARANGATWGEAAALANIAAGLEVERFGVVPIPLDEILLALLRQNHEEIGKVRVLDQLLPELAAYRRQGKTIAFTNGCFDVLHAGHVSYLRQAAQMGDLLVVALNSDASIRRLKGPDRPVNHQDDRVLILSELACVDYVIVFEEDTPTRLIQVIRPDVLIKGGDYTKGEVVGGEIVEGYGGKVALVPVVEGRSTTNILRKMAGERT